ncbi:hypothetical protein Emag_002728 [Eimeria magna]
MGDRNSSSSSSSSSSISSSSRTVLLLIPSHLQLAGHVAQERLGVCLHNFLLLLLLLLVPRKPFSDNLNLSAPLLSRFDLIFLLHDKPAAAADARLAAHVFSSRFNKLQQPTAAPAAAGVSAAAAAAAGGGGGDFAGEKPCLEERLMAMEARARADLRPVATAEDARDVIEVYGHTPFACPSLLAEAAAATGCPDTSGNAALASACVSASGRKPRRGLQGLVLSFARECASMMARTGSTTISQSDAMKCASLLVSRAQAAIPAEAVVAAANEGGLLLKREGRWVLDRSLLMQV